MNIKSYSLFVFALFFVQNIFGQDWLEGLDSGKSTNGPIQSTFKATRLINFQTVETPGKRTLEFRIAHRFADANGGASELFGLDGPATIKLSLDYSWDGRLMFGIGRTNYSKQVDGLIKYKLLRQSDKMPLSLSLFGSAYVVTEKEFDPQNPKYLHFSDRMNYVFQAMIARKFNENLSLQLSPTLVHLNLVEHASDKNDVLALIALGRYKITKRTAITAEYGYRMNNYIADTAVSKLYHNSFGFGFDFETGGHVFQIHFTNSFPIAENQVIPFTTNSWKDGGFRLGFNISRVFRL